jgi:hypothetical protein
MGLVCLASGCAHAASPPPFQPPVLPPDLPAVVQSSLAVDTSALPKDAHPYPADASYRGLTEADCPRLAARASTLGNLLDQKAQAWSPSRSTWFLRSENSSEQTRIVLQLAADEARHRSAGDAMEAFYHLIEAEGRRALLLLGLKEVNESLMRAEELQVKGLPLPVETEVIRKQLTDLRSDEARLRITIHQLNGRLKVLLGLSSGDYSVWPLADLRVDPEEPDIDQAVDYGLNHRPDLALLRMLAYCPDANSLAIATQTLAVVSPLLGEAASSPCCPWHLVRGDDCQTERVRQQLQSLLMERQRQVTEEIRQAAGVLGDRIQLVILARQKVEIEERRIRELEEKKEKGLDAEEELSTARLNLYEAQGEQLREVVNWKIARAQLRQEQGRLLEEAPWADNVAPVAPTESAP